MEPSDPEFSETSAMEPVHTLASSWRLYVSLFLLAFISLQPARATSIVSEHEQLTALTRQLDLADYLASQASGSSTQGHSRYYFDYTRLRDDLKRVRTGVQDYLVPQRAQPRDPVLLDGHYTDAAAHAEEASP